MPEGIDIECSGPLPTIIIPRRIQRSFIVENKQFIFVYGYDIAEKGIFGQAFFAHGEPNAFPIYTCHKMCKSSAFFSDGQYDEIKPKIDSCIKRIKEAAGRKPIIPFPRIGRGYSRLDEFSPKIFKYLTDELNKIKYPFIIYQQIC